MRFSPHVDVCASGVAIHHTHAEDAARMVLEGSAVRVSRNRIDLIPHDPGAPSTTAHGNPQKYTYLEPVGSPVVGHCHRHKPRITEPRNWPMFRAAVVDCLPAAQQAEIRALFASADASASSQLIALGSDLPAPARRAACGGGGPDD